MLRYQIVPQDIDDEDFTLVVDEANYFAFKIMILRLILILILKAWHQSCGLSTRDQYDQEYWDTSGIQTVSFCLAGAVNDVVSGTKAVGTTNWWIANI